MPLHPTHPPTLGARYLGDRRCWFKVWAPKASRLKLKILGTADRLIDLPRDDEGYYSGDVDGVDPGTRYLYQFDDGRERPDPASQWQPDGVHAASAVVDPHFAWTDEHWRGLPLHEYITYELHVGTFTPEGTFEAAITHLDELHELGVTAIELLPVAQFPGARNWGYDGVHPFAVQNTYGGPAGLKRLVNACHARGLAVILDVVYNHLGPEGNYFGEFGYYFTNRYMTPWGDALNFDGRESDHVRRFFIENALFWIDEYHIDALRLDAVHAIFDNSARPFLRELADAVRLEGERLNRRVYTIGESSDNDPRLVQPADVGGMGLDAHWCNDLHHAVRTTIDDERTGYYADFHGFRDVVKAYREGYVLDGQYSHYRGRAHGRPGRAIPPVRLVVYSQNHDQVGNRVGGERLAQLVDFERQKLAAALVILSPYQPLIFMGEEYGERNPFHYFVSHGDASLIEAVRRGRRSDFASFRYTGDFWDPADEQTMVSSRLDHHRKQTEPHATTWRYYRELLHMRRASSTLAFNDRERMEVDEVARGTTMAVRRWSYGHEVVVLFHCSPEPATLTIPLGAGTWKRQLDSADARWRGPGSSIQETIESSGECSLRFAPYSAVVLAHTSRHHQRM